jgi:hypothetical protein
MVVPAGWVVLPGRLVTVVSAGLVMPPPPAAWVVRAVIPVVWVRAVLAGRRAVPALPRVRPGRRGLR